MLALNDTIFTRGYKTFIYICHHLALAQEHANLGYNKRKCNYLKNRNKNNIGKVEM